jgi:hypothetical protein
MFDPNQYIINNYTKIEEISKRVLKGRWREGVSSYYLYMIEKTIEPKNINTNCYYYMVNLDKPNGELNYLPIALRDSESEDCEYGEDIETKLDMMIDLDNEELVDFLINNDQSDNILKIYKILYEKKLELNLFEQVVFDYVFKDGLSIQKIANITGNSKSWIYRFRKDLITKIKENI